MTTTTPIRSSTAADADRERLVWAVHAADRVTPVQAFARLRAAGHRASLLESVDGPARLARHSFVALDPIASFRARGAGATLSFADERPAQALAGPPLATLREAQRIVHGEAPRPTRHPDLPPFRGGWLGAFAYELATTLEPRVPRPDADDFEFPDASLDCFRDVVAFDHGRQLLTIVCAAPGGARDHAAALERATAISADLDRSAPAGDGFRLLPDALKESLDDAQFAAGVKRLQREIRAGEIFQAVLSRRFSRAFEGDPFTLYRVLRLVNPAPHMFFHECDDVTLVGSSPERLVSLSGRSIGVVPIAGTRPRGATEEEDERLAADLRRSPKERAEHDMLVDLARNDVGRVARVGSVEVREHASLERFPRVQHLVSRVAAELATGFDALDLLAATFPAGTVSGAPKVRAMELLADVERAARGPYAGAFGYLDAAGDLDVAITIRTIVCRGGVAHVQAGAGVVLDSDPDAEAAETRHKASALLEALDLAASPAFQPTENALPPSAGTLSTRTPSAGTLPAGTLPDATLSHIQGLAR